MVVSRQHLHWRWAATGQHIAWIMQILSMYIGKILANNPVTSLMIIPVGSINHRVGEVHVRYIPELFFAAHCMFVVVWRVINATPTWFKWFDPKSAKLQGIRYTFLTGNETGPIFLMGKTVPWALFGVFLAALLRSLNSIWTHALCPPVIFLAAEVPCESTMNSVLLQTLRRTKVLEVNGIYLGRNASSKWVKWVETTLFWNRPHYKPNAK